MKFFLLFSLFISLFACNSKAPVQYVKPSYDTSGTISVFYMVDVKKLLFSLMPAKRIIRHYMSQDGIDSTTNPGQYILKFKPMVDSIYLVATVDSTVTYKDSTGKEILDSATKKVQYLPSFRKPTVVPKLVVTETQTISFPNIK